MSTSYHVNVLPSLSAKSLINALWNNIYSLWKHRNVALYGKGREEATEIDCRKLHEHFATEYTVHCAKPAFLKNVH
jgi:hypothetical protein